MLVSGIVATASLVTILVAAFLGAVLLAYIDKRCASGREH